MYEFSIPDHLRPYTREVMVDGIKLHCYDAGSGDATPMLLIHGLGDESDTWRHVLLPLARHRRIVAVDLPGFGRSDRPHRPYTLAFFAQTVLSLMDALGLHRAILVGSSMGAATAQRLALVRPDLVERLVLIGGSLPTVRAIPMGPIWLFLAPGLGEGFYTSLRRSADAGYSTLQPYYYSLDALPEADRTFLKERVRARVFSDGQRRAYLSALRWLMIERAFRADQFHSRVITQRTPATLIWGEHDLIAPVASAYAMAALLPKAQVHVIPECGHLPQQERPEELLGILESVALTGGHP
jgi:pimeloyl-ACP methyl ester carboxylesterase